MSRSQQGGSQGRGREEGKGPGRWGSRRSLSTDSHIPGGLSTNPPSALRDGGLAVGHVEPWAGWERLTGEGTVGDDQVNPGGLGFKRSREMMAAGGQDGSAKGLGWAKSQAKGCSWRGRSWTMAGGDAEQGERSSGRREGWMWWPSLQGSFLIAAVSRAGEDAQELRERVAPSGVACRQRRSGHQGATVPRCHPTAWRALPQEGGWIHQDWDCASQEFPVGEGAGPEGVRGV